MSIRDFPGCNVSVSKFFLTEAGVVYFATFATICGNTFLPCLCHCTYPSG